MPISLVSVIIPVFNGLPELDEQLAALAAQDYGGRFEVILSDNGSTDGLRQHLADLDLALDIRWIDSSDVRGTPHARNAGMNAARGEFLAFTDQDDAVHQGWLSALVRAAEDFDAVGGPIEVETLNSAEVASWRPPPPPERPFETPYLPYAHGNNFAMWSRVAAEVGPFDEEFTGGGEDVDISWRIQQAGLTLGHVPEAVVAYRLRTTLRATFRQSVRYGWTACQVTLKHRDRSGLYPPAFLALPGLLGSIAYLLVARNPWLPRAFNPPTRGLWVMLIGHQYGALRMRANFLRRALGRAIRAGDR
ncbi:glycosyltransferase [Rhodococcus fascians]|nr:glycosyltransferase [Rhodococcus fascians]